MRLAIRPVLAAVASILWVFGVSSQVLAQSAAAGRPLPSGTYRLEPAVIPDPSGMAQPMAAATLFLPYGWRSQGGVVWGPQHACTDYFNFDWKAVSPDGLSSLGVIPQAGWEMDNTGHANTLKIGCRKSPVNSTQGYLQVVVQAAWPGASIQGFRRRPDLEAPERSGPTQGGGQMRMRAEAGELRFVFRQQGREMEGLIAAVVNFTHTRLPVQGMGALQFMTAQALPGYAVVTPAGQLDGAFFERIRRSIQPNPAWLQEVSRHAMVLRRGEQIGAQQRQQIWHNTQQQIAQMRVEAWNAGQRSADQRAADFSQMIRDVEHYQGADGRKTELAAGYAQAWRLSDGSYLMSSRPDFDPNRDLGLEGRRLDPARR